MPAHGVSEGPVDRSGADTARGGVDLHLFLRPLALRFRMVGGVLMVIDRLCMRLLTNCCRRRAETRAPEQWR
jgi:hypothetical protein